jgi:uncharacterized protein
MTKPEEHGRRPWHEGEATMQRLAAAASPPPVIRPFMTEQLRKFFPQLSLLFMAAVDADGFPCPTFLRGVPGFVACPDPARMEIAAAVFRGDSLGSVLRPGTEIGLLGVDFTTRRRNRVNGRIASLGAQGMSVAVAEAFGNCPKYIRPRYAFDALVSDKPRFWEPLESFDGALKAAVAGAETFFVASSANCACGGVDISHRGGAPGFLDIEADGAIVVPDFLGNGYFNTLGNLLLQPRAGLLFPNFETGEALRLAGTADIGWVGAKPTPSSAAERLWRFRPCRAWRLRSLEGAPSTGE